MLSFYPIWTVARFEIKTLLRSWFFRIFAGLSVLAIALFDLGVFALGRSPWMFRGIPASIPYVNLLLLNVAQAIIAVFLASDFLKRDSKLDTTEVIYMRSMTNGDYVVGKTLGILLVFMGLNLLVLLIAAIYNIFFAHIPMVLQAYLYYPLLISLPTLVYIVGLSFLSMVLFRSQAVTFIVLLGYIGTTLFFLGRRFHYVFDYMVFNVPLAYSDFVGFGNLAQIVLHRGIYLSLGLCFICATIRLLRRLPQSPWMTRLSVILALVFFAGGAVLGSTYLSRLFQDRTLRKNMLELNNELIRAPRVSMTRCDLDLMHRGSEIEGVAKLVFQNRTSEPIHRYVFRINPGLKIRTMERDGKPLTFDRSLHVISVVPSSPLAPQATDSLTLHYQGTIDEAACYLDVDEGERAQRHRAFLYNIDKRHSFVTPDYVLLSPESLWYPVAGVSYSSDRPIVHHRDFIPFKLRVTTNPALSVLSQGRATEVGRGTYSFHPEVPLPQLSLVIGKYETRSIAVDSVEYSLHTLRGHDYFAPYFDVLGDTLAALVRDLKREYEVRLDLPYPYPRLSLIEVPVQFFSYPRLWTTGQETVQPELVLLPEKGVTLNGADFEQFQRWEQQRVRRTHQVITPLESQSGMFRRLVTSTLGTGGGMTRFRPGNVPAEQSNYEVFPNYFTFVVHLKSAHWPVLNLALESYLKSRATEAGPPGFRMSTGLTPEDKANLALAGHSLSEILADPDKRDIAPDVLSIKGTYLFALFQSQMGDDAFQKALNGFLASHRFQGVAAEDFIASLESASGIDLTSPIEAWHTSRELPGFLFADVQGYGVLDADRTRYQVRFKVSNPEPADGLLKLSFRTGGLGGGRGGFGGTFQGRPGGDSDVEHLVSVAAQQTKEVGIVLDDAPRMMTINTLISKNLPSTLDRPFRELELDRKAVPFEGERVLDEPLQMVPPGEIIVDNEDPGFRVLDASEESWLKKWLRRFSSDDDDRYVGVQLWRPSEKWTATAQSDFYGRYVHSAYFVKAGKGDRKVAWSASIPESGQYDVYGYSAGRLPRFRGPPGGGPNEGRRGRGQDEGQYHFLIYHDDGVEEALLDRRNAEEGWNFLGTYYLSAGTARVELTNESEGRIVFADAIRWVKR